MEYEEFEYIKGGHLSLSFYMYDIPELVFPSRISFIEDFMTLVQGCDVSYSNCFYIGLYLNYDICIYLRILVPNRISISDDDPVILAVAG